MSYPNGWSDFANTVKPNANDYYEAINNIDTSGTSITLSDEQKHQLANATASASSSLIDNGLLGGVPVYQIALAPLLKTLTDIHYKDEGLGQAALSSGLGSILGTFVTTRLKSVLPVILAGELAKMGIGGAAATTLVGALTPALAAAGGFALAYAFNEAVDALFQEEDVLEKFGAKLGDLLYDILHPYEDFSIPRDFTDLINAAYTVISPLVLDLDGDGIETIGVNNSTVMFDLDGDGRLTKSGWLAGDDGFLVFDRNGDGLVNDGGELFGNNTKRYDIPRTRGYSIRLESINCRDGFAALAQEDTNGDGIVNNLDANWSQLRIWRDLNQDGSSQADELFSLEDVGVSGIKVDYTAANTKQNGNTLYGTGSYIDISGDSHYMTDAWFEQDTFISGYTDTIEIPEDMRGLPNMGGSGAVRNLLEAAAQEAKAWEPYPGSPNQKAPLEHILEQYSQADTRAEQMDLLDDLLYAWANTSGFYRSIETRCSGIYNVEQLNVPNGDVAAWNRKIHILEAFNGRYFFTDLPRGGENGLAFNPNAPHGNLSIISRRIDDDEPTPIPTLRVNWGQTQMEKLNEAYDLLCETVYNALLLQTRLAPVLDLIDLTIDLESFDISFDFTRVTQHFTEKMATDPVNGLSDLMEFTRITSDMLSGSGWNGYDVAYEAIKGMDTPSLQELLKSLQVNMVGVEGYNPNGVIGDDFTIGGAGNDTLSGNNGNDVLYGGEGDDKLYGNSGNDVLDGGDGNDYLEGGAGNDVYVFGKGYGNDRVYTYDGGGAGKRDIVRLIGLGRDDVEFLSTPNGANGYCDLIIRIKESGETLKIIGATNNFNTSTVYAPQAIEFGDGSVMEWSELEKAGLLKAVGTDGDDTINVSNLDTVVEGLAGNDTLNGADGNDTLYGGEGDDKLYGNYGNDMLYGGEGNDSLYGNADNDVLDGGAGNDYLEGGAGNDVYVFGKGYGNDRVYAYDTATGKRDVVRLIGLGRDDVEFLSVPNAASGYYDLIIRIKESGETLNIIGAIYQSNSPYEIQAIEFGDGSVIEWPELEKSGLLKVVGTDKDDTISAGRLDTVVMEGLAGNDKLNGAGGNDMLYGGEGNDSLYGNAGNDVLDGGTGNDYLEGGTGNDVYVFGKGYGDDRVYAYDTATGKRDVVRLIGLGRDDVEFLSIKNTASGYHDFIIRIKESGETLKIVSAIYQSNTFTGYEIQAIEFGDGSVMEWSELEKSGLLQVVGTDEDDTINGSRLNTVMEGLAGNDTLNGAGGNDVLYGGEGDDTLYGGGGNDVLEGGAGTDYLEGGAGNDVYVFGKGYGNDAVYANDNSTSKRDVVRLVGLTADEVEFMTDRDPGNSNYYQLVIRIKETGETLAIPKAIYNPSATTFNPYSIQAIEFGDGTVMEWAELTASGRLSSFWTEGDDTQYGSRLNTHMYGGAGNDYLSDGSGNGVLDGGEGDDRLYGNAGNDVLDGGAGTDYLEGGTGNDVYVFGKGYGNDAVYAYDSSSSKRDTVRLVGLTEGDVDFITERDTGNSYHHLIIRIRETGETLTIQKAIYNSSATTFNYYGIQAIEFGDGTALEWSDFESGKVPLIMSYTDGDDTLYGSRLGTPLHGGSGNDALNGGSGNDVLYGGEGDDKLYGNAGHDVLDGGAGTDSLDGGAGNDFLYGGEGDDRLYGSDGHDVLDGGAGTDYLEGGAGNDFLYGGEGDDRLYGNAGNDVLDGGAGTDYLEGGSGNDVYVFGKGYGDDAVYAYDSSSSKRNTVRLVGLTAGDVDFITELDTGDSNYHHLIIRIKETGETLTIQRAIYNYSATTPLIITASRR